jgi:hypothetical protein
VGIGAFLEMTRQPFRLAQDRADRARLLARCPEDPDAGAARNPARSRP